MFRKLLIRCAITAIAVVFGAPSIALAQTAKVYVDATSTNTAAPSGGNPGDSWTTNVPYKYLQNGIARAVTLLSSASDVEIHVRGATGTGMKYYPDEGTGQTNNARASHFELNDDISILGNFIGTGANAETRDPSYLTILSGDVNQDKAGQPRFIGHR